MSTATDIFFRSDRERFVDAVIGLSAERGWEQLSVEALAQHSGLPQERFRELFGETAGVENCMVAAETEIVGELIATVCDTYPAERFEWDSGIRRMLALLELMAANPSKAYFNYVTARYAGPRVRAVESAGSLLMTTIVDRLRTSAPEATAPVPTAEAALGGGEALIRREILAGRTEGLPSLAPSLMYVLVVPFLGQDAALGMARRASEMLRGSAWG